MSDPETESGFRHGVVARIFPWGFIVIFARAILKKISNLEYLRDIALLHIETAFAPGFVSIFLVHIS